MKESDVELSRIKVIKKICMKMMIKNVNNKS